jgi:hypothetical protein
MDTKVFLLYNKCQIWHWVMSLDVMMRSEDSFASYTKIQGHFLQYSHDICQLSLFFLTSSSAAPSASSARQL